jgi:hypothetical protein
MIGLGGGKSASFLLAIKGIKCYVKRTGSFCENVESNM